MKKTHIVFEAFKKKWHEKFKCEASLKEPGMDGSSIPLMHLNLG